MTKDVFPVELAESFLEEAIKFLKDKGLVSLHHDVAVNLGDVSKKEIQDLNQTYREKNEPTDVLSFGYQFNEKKLEGDLIVCWEIIKENAKEDRIKSEDELRKNIIHGCLHIVGYDHSDEMFELQDKFLELNLE